MFLYGIVRPGKGENVEYYSTSSLDEKGVLVQQALFQSDDLQAAFLQRRTQFFVYSKSSQLPMLIVSGTFNHFGISDVPLPRDGLAELSCCLSVEYSRSREVQICKSLTRDYIPILRLFTGIASTTKEGEMNKKKHQEDNQ